MGVPDSSAAFPLSPLGEACKRMDLTAIHEVLEKIGYKDDEGAATEVCFWSVNSRTYYKPFKSFRPLLFISIQPPTPKKKVNERWFLSLELFVVAFIISFDLLGCFSDTSIIMTNLVYWIAFSLVGMRKEYSMLIIGMPNETTLGELVPHHSSN